MSSRRNSPEVVAGLFVTLGILLLAGAVLALGGGKRLFTRFIPYRTHYASVSGLIPGARVMVSGVRAGSVVGVSLDPVTKDIRVDLEIEEEFSRWIRTDSEAELSTQGMMGDKFIVISAGSPAEPELPPGAPIRGVERGDLGTFLARGNELLESLNRSADSLAGISAKLDASLEADRLRSSLRALESILMKIDGGQGSLGAFINDPSIYDDAKAVVGEVNRNRIMRNLVRQAVRGGAGETARAREGAAENRSQGGS